MYMYVYIHIQKVGKDKCEPAALSSETLYFLCHFFTNKVLMKEDFSCLCLLFWICIFVLAKLLICIASCDHLYLELSDFLVLLVLYIYI